MFSYTHPPGASVAWPPRDERQGWPMPPTCGGRGDGGVNDAAAPPRAARLWKDEVDEDHRDRDGDTAAPERDPAGACRWLAERATPWRTSARPFPPDPAPSAHPACPATNLRRGGAGQDRARTGRDVTRDLQGRREGRVTGGDGRRTDGGETTSVINDVRRPRREHGEHRLMLTGRGWTCRETRLTSRRLTRDNCSYRESNGQISVLGR